MSRQVEMNLDTSNCVLTRELVNSPLAAIKWARERHSIFLKRSEGVTKPWTKDPFLSSYRFCNVYRQIDTVSLWIKENVIDKYEDTPYLWYLLAISRSINHVPTIKNILDARAWDDPDHMYKIMCDMKERGEQIFTGAYLVNSVFQPYDGDVPREKHYYMAYLNLGKLYENRREVSPGMKISMESAVETLKTQRGYGPFVAYQIAVDLSYSSKWLKDCEDMNTFNSPGPGTKRGLDRLFGGASKTTGFTKQKDAWYSEKIQELFQMFQKQKYWKITSDDPMTGFSPVEMSNVSNCLCETDKILRLYLDEGRPRSRYQGT